jgi:hypothetical protein
MLCLANLWRIRFSGGCPAEPRLRLIRKSIAVDAVRQVTALRETTM